MSETVNHGGLSRLVRVSPSTVLKTTKMKMVFLAVGCSLVLRFITVGNPFSMRLHINNHCPYCYYIGSNSEERGSMVLTFDLDMTNNNWP